MAKCILNVEDGERTRSGRNENIVPAPGTYKDTLTEEWEEPGNTWGKGIIKENLLQRASCSGLDMLRGHDEYMMVQWH